MLLVLEPFALVLLAIGEDVGAGALTLTLDILALVGVACGEGSLTLAIGLLAFQFTCIDGSVGEGISAYLDG